MASDDQVSKSEKVPIWEMKTTPCVMPKTQEQTVSQTDWQKIRAQYASMTRHERLIAAWQALAKNSQPLYPEEQPA